MIDSWSSFSCWWSWSSSFPSGRPFADRLAAVAELVPPPLAHDPVHQAAAAVDKDSQALALDRDSASRASNVGEPYCFEK